MGSLTTFLKGTKNTINNQSSVKVIEDDTSKENTLNLVKENNVQETGTYKRILNLLPEEALATLPNEVYKVLGFEFINPFKKALVKMRECGIAHLIYAERNNEHRLFMPDEKDILTVEYDTQNKVYNYFFNGKIINRDIVIVFGNEYRQLEAKLNFSSSQIQTILRYENALEKFYSKLDNSYAWILKINGLDDKYVNQKYLQRIQQKTKEIANRKASGVVYLDKEDDFLVSQMDLGWFEPFIKEYKTKICVDFNIPFTKFFGEGASGLNATGEGDRRSWYDTVKTFQSLYIFKNLKQLASLIGKDETFNKIDLENIEQTDKEAEARIQSEEMANLALAHNTGALTEEEYREEVLRVLHIKQDTSTNKKEL